MLNIINCKKINWYRVYALSILAIMGFYLLRTIAPARCADIYNAYIPLAVGLLMGFFLARNGLQSFREIKIYFFFAIWVLLTRWLNKDVYLFIDHKLVLLGFLSFLFLSAAVFLDRKERELFVDGITVLYGGFYLLAAMAAVFVFVCNTYIHLPPENTWISIKQESSLFSIHLLSTHRLENAPNLLMAYYLFVYQFFKRKNKLARVLVIAAVFFIHLAISLCHSRTSQIALSGTMAMLSMLLLMPKVKHFKFAPRVALVCGLAASVLVCFYLSFDLSNALITKAHSVFTPRFEAYFNSLENKPNEDYFGLRIEYTELSALAEDAEESAGAQDESPTAQTKESSDFAVQDNRKLAGNWTFTERTLIWHAGIVRCLREPVMLIKGDLEKTYMAPINEILRELYPFVTETKLHMHNSFMEVLVLAGLPGFVLAIAWTVMVVGKMLKIFFCAKEEVDLATKMLTVPLAGMFVICFFEPFLFMGIQHSTIIFFLMVGIFLKSYSECFPEKG